jgi:ABC-2 type transport system ATP-binding protein
VAATDDAVAAGVAAVAGSAAVQVDELTIRYGDVVAVDGLSFTAEAGQVTCVLGRNGAGKTSTIEALEGVRRPAGGRLSVLGLDPRRDHATLVTKVGVMLQDVGIHPAARTGELVRHAAGLYPAAVALDPVELIERVGLAGLERRTFRQLSGGEQRRLALALALVGRPEMVFLDEPTAGVDPAGRQQVRSIIAGLRDEGVTVLLSTHDLTEAERLADRIVIIDHGRLRASGTLASLTAAGDGGERLHFRTSVAIDIEALSAHLDGVPVTAGSGPDEYVVAAPPAPSLIASVTSWLADHDVVLSALQTGARDLEDVFLGLTSDNGTGAGQPAPAGEARA